MAFFEELKRRRVVRVGVAYIVVGWALVEAASVLFPMFEAPDWVLKGFTIMIALGFPLALVLAWAIQWTSDGPVVDTGDLDDRSIPKGKVRFVRSPDGTRLAYSVSGSGPPIVKTAHWLTHLDKDWDSPLWGHWLRGFARDNTLLRYDERGCGLSDRTVDDVSLDAFVMDLETVVDAAGLERFALLGASQGGPVSVAYAVKHPERVSALVLYGSYARGWAMRRDDDILRQEKAMLELIRTGWGKDTEAFRGLYASLFIPDAKTDERQSFVDMARESTSPDMGAKLIESFSHIDVTDLLPQVRVPTLVLHVRGDTRISIGNGRELASGIPGAEFVPIEGRNHILLAGDSGLKEFFAATQEFLGKHNPEAGSRTVT
jgi:pimeloyl-ACP methyl ester carboxylesterase